MDTTVICIAGIFLVWPLYYWLRARSTYRPQPLPPGPPGLPIVGNAFDIPSSMPWKTFQELSKKYGISLQASLGHIHESYISLGDIMFFKIPTQRIVVLNSVEAAVDLLEKRSDIYSSRHQPLMLNL